MLNPAVDLIYISQNYKLVFFSSFNGQELFLTKDHFSYFNKTTKLKPHLLP